MPDQEKNEIQRRLRFDTVDEELSGIEEKIDKIKESQNKIIDKSDPLYNQLELCLIDTEALLKKIKTNRVKWEEATKKLDAIYLSQGEVYQESIQYKDEVPFGVVLAEEASGYGHSVNTAWLDGAISNDARVILLNTFTEEQIKALLIDDPKEFISYVKEHMSNDPVFWSQRLNLPKFFVYECLYLKEAGYKFKFGKIPNKPEDYELVLSAPTDYQRLTLSPRRPGEELPENLINRQGTLSHEVSSDVNPGDKLEELDKVSSQGSEVQQEKLEKVSSQGSEVPPIGSTEFSKGMVTAGNQEKRQAEVRSLDAASGMFGLGLAGSGSIGGSGSIDGEEGLKSSQSQRSQSPGRGGPSI